MIELRSLSLTYPGASGPALDDVSLSIAKGELVALVGASGSGKTSLLKTINRLHDPDSGDVSISNENVRNRDVVSLRRSIGYVFQGIGLFPHMTCAENIAITLRLQGSASAQMHQRVSELLDMVELPADFADRYPAQLSGGQRQRIGIARALAASPPVLLMDEPFGALDPLTRDNLGQACRQLHDRLGLTTLMVTHDIQEALVLANRIVVMEGGRVVTDATPTQILQSETSGSALTQMFWRQWQRMGELAAQGRAAKTQSDVSNIRVAGDE